MVFPELCEHMWYGTEAAHQSAVALEANLMARFRAGPFAEMPDANPNYLLTKQRGVGIVAIKGPLLNTDNFFTAMFGVATYPAIRRAMVAAANDPEIKSVLLDVDSGGGAVSGVADTADLIKRVDTKVKPVHTFASGAMASAAYWLGVSGRSRAATQTSEVGSIGVLTVHIDRTEQFKQDGIKATVIRSGKFKALDNPFEPLSDLAKEQLQERVDAAYKVFGSHVADRLGMTFEAMDRKVGQGRVFFGAQAKDSGLVGEITNLDVVMSRLSKPQ